MAYGLGPMAYSIWPLPIDRRLVSYGIRGSKTELLAPTLHSIAWCRSPKIHPLSADWAPKAAKVRPKVAKVHPKVTKVRPKVAKVHPKVTKVCPEVDHKAPNTEKS